MLGISIQIKGRQLAGASTDSSNAHLVGDITDVYLRSRITEPPSPSSSLVFVHVTDVPVGAIEDVWFLNEPLLDGDNEIVNRHEWFFDVGKATPEEIEGLTNLREITVSWNRVKQVMMCRSTGNLITDADLSG